MLFSPPLKTCWRYTGRRLSAICAVHKTPVGMDVDGARRLPGSDVVGLGQGVRLKGDFGVDPAVLHPEHVHLVLCFDRHVNPRFGRMKVQVPRAEFFAPVRRDRNLVGQRPVLVIEHFQRPRIFRLCGGPFISTGTRMAKPLSGVTRT